MFFILRGRATTDLLVADWVSFLPSAPGPSAPGIRQHLDAGVAFVLKKSINFAAWMLEICLLGLNFAQV